MAHSIKFQLDEGESVEFSNSGQSIELFVENLNNRCMDNNYNGDSTLVRICRDDVIMLRNALNDWLEQNEFNAEEE